MSFAIQLIDMIMFVMFVFNTKITQIRFVWDKVVCLFSRNICQNSPLLSIYNGDFCFKKSTKIVYSLKIPLSCVVKSLLRSNFLWLFLFFFIWCQISEHVLGVSNYRFTVLYRLCDISVSLYKNIVNPRMI